MSSMRSILAVLLVGCLGAAACSSSSGDDEIAAQATTSTPDTTSGTSAATAEAADDADGETTVSTNSIPNHPDTLIPTCEQPGVFEVTLDVGIDKRDVRVFVPSGATLSSELPLVVNWHGLGSSGPDQAQFTAYEDLAETEGFLVAHPTGDPGSSGQNNWEFGRFDDPVKDDLAYANALFDALVDHSCADATRIYSTGMSNGGLFTAHLICELADRIAAAASVAGLSHADDCAPSRAVPYIAFHGTADEIVTFDGGSGGGALFSEVMPQEFAQFAADFGCDLIPIEEAVADDVIRYDYLGCDGDVPVSFYEITDGGHTWPSSPLGPFVEGTLGRTTTSIDATADAWAFFQQHSL